MALSSVRGGSEEPFPVPLILRCDAPGCAEETVARTSILGRPQAPQGWHVQNIALHGRGLIVVACSDNHLPAAAEAVRPVEEP